MPKYPDNPFVQCFRNALWHRLQPVLFTLDTQTEVCVTYAEESR